MKMTISEMKTKPKVIYNSQYGNVYLYYIKLKGKHCRKPHWRNGFVDHLGQAGKEILQMGQQPLSWAYRRKQ
jgi:hypothetical protein